MTLPHVDLGNSYQDVGQGANTFASGLMAQRQRSQQLALQEALAKSKMAMDDATTQHIGAQTDQLIPAQAGQANAQTGDINAQAAQRESENLPADDGDEERLRQVEPNAHPGVFRGMTKAQAAEYTKVLANANAMKLRLGMTQNRFEDRGQVAYNPDGTAVIIRPNQPNGGGAEPIGSYSGQGQDRTFNPDNVGKPLTPNERVFAGTGQAAQSAHHDLTQFESENPQALNEIAKAISLPNFGHLIPGMGSNVSRVLQAFRLQGASPQAQAYLKRMFDFAGVVGPKRYGLRGMQNEVTLQQLWTDFGAGQFGLTREGIAAAQKNRENAVNQLQESAGPRAWDQSQSIFPQGAPVTTPANKYGYKR